MPHRKTGAYYRELLDGNLSGVVEAIQDDAAEWLQQPVMDQPVLALEDGDPEEDGAMMPPDTSVSHMWGPFQFTHVTRGKIANGEPMTWCQWQVRCPFHRDSDDKQGTACTKTLQWVGDDDRDRVALLLRRWCVAGRHANSRVARERGVFPHKAMLGTDRVLHAVGGEVPDRDLEVALQTGLEAESWVTAPMSKPRTEDVVVQVALEWEAAAGESDSSSSSSSSSS